MGHDLAPSRVSPDDPQSPFEAVATLWENGHASTKSGGTLLSICIPIYRFNVEPLLSELLTQASALRDIELILADDGSDDAAQIERLKSLSSHSNVPVRLYAFAQNQGRASIRTFLIKQARCRYVLFLDCDMQPDTRHFLECYLDLASAGTSDVVVGGCSQTLITTVSPSKRLYHFFTMRTQCVPLAARQQHPMRYAFTSNIMIRRHLLDEFSFDEGYVGWGYEDTDFAINVSQAGHKILHIDNPATHLGLNEDESFIRRYEQSARNFLHLLQRFPRETADLPITKITKFCQGLALPYRSLSRLSRMAASTTFFPLRVRYLALQCLKLSTYAAAARTQSSDSDLQPGCRT